MQSSVPEPSARKVFRGQKLFPLLLAALSLLPLACGRSLPTRFYLLTPQETRTANPAPDSLIVGVGPVELPDYLDRPQILTRAGEHEIHFAEFDQWGGSLKSNIAYVVAENLGERLNLDAVYTYPWRTAVRVGFQVGISVIRLDARLGGSATLEARWTLLDDDGRRVLLTRRSAFQLPMTGSEYADIVDAQSRLFAALSDQIAETIRARARK
jgi:uncharacterized lipoprotein YmbA